MGGGRLPLTATALAGIVKNAAEVERKPSKLTDGLRKATKDGDWRNARAIGHFRRCVLRHRSKNGGEVNPTYFALLYLTMEGEWEAEEGMLSPPEPLPEAWFGLEEGEREGGRRVIAARFPELPPGSVALGVAQPAAPFSPQRA